jgi:hypothetical protein
MLMMMMKMKKKRLYCTITSKAMFSSLSTHTHTQICMSLCNFILTLTALKLGAFRLFCGINRLKFIVFHLLMLHNSLEASHSRSIAVKIWNLIYQPTILWPALYLISLELHTVKMDFTFLQGPLKMNEKLRKWKFM